MSKLLKTIIIKEGMPSVEDARKRMIGEIQSAKAEGWTALKVIHVYGSTGVGGKLKDALRSSLSRRQKEGSIRLYVFGEKWTVFEPKTRELLDKCQELRRDPDLERANEGMTLILL